MDVEGGVSEDLKYHRLLSESQRVSRIVSLNCYVGILLCVFACVVLGAAFIPPHALAPETKLFFGTVVAVAVIGLFVVLILARHDVSSLLLFTTLAVFLAGFILGVAACAIQGVLHKN